MAAWVEGVLNRGEKLFRLVWLLEISRRSLFVCFLAEAGLLAGCNKNNGSGRGEESLDSFGQGKAIAGGQADVQQHQVRGIFDCGIQSSQTVVSRGCLIAGGFDPKGQRQGDFPVIFDDEDALHRLS